ncbi:MAG: PqqD family protein [Clostridiales bacterium]|nr:PqqD family protein [Clostridiales bacterium]
MMINMSSEVVLNDSVLTTLIDDELGMMSINLGFYYTLNSVGKRIWEILENQMKVSDVIDTLRKEYDVDLLVCEKDVLELLVLLEQNQLITVVE